MAYNPQDHLLALTLFSYVGKTRRNHFQQHLSLFMVKKSIESPESKTLLYDVRGHLQTITKTRQDDIQAASVDFL